MSADDSLLDEIYESVIVRNDYARILSRLSRRLGSHAGAVLERHGPFLRFRAVSNLDASIMETYNREYYARDPWVLAEGVRPPGTPLIGSRLIDPYAVEATGFFEDVLRPHDIWDILNNKFRISPDLEIHFTFYRPHREVFSPADAVRFTSLGRHIERAARLRVSLERDGRAHDPEGLFQTIGLTTKEEKVADLVLRGHTYAMIGEFLSITRNTVHWHVRNIFAKAGVRSKGEFIARHAFARIAERKAG